MTYRATRGGRAARRRKHKDKEHARELRAGVLEWLADHPPRLYPTIEHGEWQTRGGDVGYYVEFSAAPRPKHPIYRVPAMPANPRLISPDRLGEISMYEPITMRPIAMGLQAGSTYLRWWNWEPVRGSFGPAEADIYHLAGKAESFATRCSALIREWNLRSLARQAHLDMMYGEAFHGGPSMRLLSEHYVDWFDELANAICDWRGKLRTRYVLPPEELGASPEAVVR